MVTGGFEMKLRPTQTFFMELINVEHNLKTAIERATHCQDTDLIGYGIAIGRIEELGRRLCKLSLSEQQNVRYTTEP